jgi:hypothetical protein
MDSGFVTSRLERVSSAPERALGYPSAPRTTIDCDQRDRALGSPAVVRVRSRVAAFLAASCVVSLAGCAAMKRTWDFQAAEVKSPTLQAVVTSAEVTRNSVDVELEVVNRSSGPIRLDVGTLHLYLPDGTAVEGGASLLSRGMDLSQSALVGLGLAEAKDDRVRPDQAAQLLLEFREPRRDLRRFAELRVVLTSILVNGQPSDLPNLILKAPPEAPMGEDI